MATVSNAGLTPTDPSSPTGSVTFTVLNETTSISTVYGPFTLSVGANGVSTAVDPTIILNPAADYAITAAYSGDTADTTATATTLFHIVPATPVISWPTPTFVFTGTALSSTQLDFENWISRSRYYGSPAVFNSTAPQVAPATARSQTVSARPIIIILVS